MLAQRSRRGAVAGIVVGVIVLVLIVGGIWYFVSDPFHQKVKDAFKENTTWTADQIRKDPAGYLSHAIDQADATKGKLETAQFALTKQKIEISNKLEKKSTEKSQCETLLQELKDTYNKAKAKNDWPATVRHLNFENENELKRKIVECDHYLDNAGKLVDTYTKARGTVADRLDEIEGQLTKVESLKTKLATDLETAKVQKTFEGIDNVNSNIDDIINTSEAMAKTAEKNTSVSDMIKPSGEARIDEEFDKIMDKKKGATAGKDAPPAK